jgi:hypothetical protein
MSSSSLRQRWVITQYRLLHTNEMYQHTSGNKKMEEDANRETESKLAEIKRVGKEKGNKVVQDLLQAVMDVNLEPPSKS